MAAMCADAGSIDDLDIVHAGGVKSLFGGVDPPSTIGTLLREFTFRITPGAQRNGERRLLRDHLLR
jgi:hypothetical protein